MSCEHCEYARQVADKARRDVVGCGLKLIESYNLYPVRDDPVYEGYFYPHRRPGDVIMSSSDTMDRGVIVIGTIVDTTNACRGYTPKKSVPQRT